MQYLLGQQCDNGAFPETFGAATCTGSVDATGFAVQALATVGGPAANDAAAAAGTWLVKRQHGDGSFTGNGVRNTNSTALAAQALEDLGRLKKATRPAATSAACRRSAAPRRRSAARSATTRKTGGDRILSTSQAVPALARVEPRRRQQGRQRPRPAAAGLLAAPPMTVTAGRPGTARRLAAALAATALAGLGLLAGPPAPAAAAEPCVGVVVDARLLGGGVSTGCAKGDPDSGLEALTKAGYSYAFVPRQPGQVCQIDGIPECSRTSTDTYWSYWWRAKGSSRWVYATEGAATHDPAPGATEAWVWQDGGRREPPDIALRTICPQVADAADRRRPSPSPGPDHQPGTVPGAVVVTKAAGGGCLRTYVRQAGHPSATTSAAPTATPSTASPTDQPAPRSSRDGRAVADRRGVRRPRRRRRRRRCPGPASCSAAA